jgi:hypothetical protein
MSRYTTRLVKEDEIESALDFAWPIAQQHDLFTFPFFNTSDELRDTLSLFSKKEGLFLIGIFDSDRLIALLPLAFRKSDEIGTWDKGIYIQMDKIKYAEAMEIFKEFISDELSFKRKKLYCGIRTEFQEAKKYFEAEQSVIFEEDYITNYENQRDILEINNKEKIGLNPSINILDIHNLVNNSNGKDDDAKETILKSYFDYHDKAYPGYYWTSNRIKKHIKDFRIFIVYRQSSKNEIMILGGIFLRVIEGEGDIYGLSDIGKEDLNLVTTESPESIREFLLYKVLKNGYEEGLKSTMFFCEEIKDYHLALKFGFKPLGNYRVYLWDLE